MIIAFSGRIRSGKTTLSKALASRMDIHRVSFGEYVKKYSESNSLSTDRQSLQKLGQEFVDNHLEDFCKDVLNQNGWDGKTDLIVDGIRHIVVLSKIKEIVSPQKIILIYIDIPQEILFNRDNKVNETDKREIFEKHNTENDVIYTLKEHADLYLTPDENPDVTSAIIQKYLAGLQ